MSVLLIIVTVMVVSVSALKLADTSTASTKRLRAINQPLWLFSRRSYILVFHRA